MRLGDYLMSLQNHCRMPSVHDCATVPANWCMILGLSDPIRDWRGSYSTEEEALDIIAEMGGLDVIFEYGLAVSGVKRRSGRPREGDVGIIRIAGQDASSIFTGRRWVFVGNRGIGFATISIEHIIAVWAVGDHG